MNRIETKDDLMGLIPSEKVRKIIEQMTKEPMSIRQVEREFKAGHIKGTKISGRWFAQESSLKNYKRGHRGEPPRKKR